MQKGFPHHVEIEVAGGPLNLFKNAGKKGRIHELLSAMGPPAEGTGEVAGVGDLDVGFTELHSTSSPGKIKRDI